MRKSAAYTHPLWGYGIYKYEVYQDGVSGVSWYCREGMKEEGRCGLTPHALHRTWSAATLSLGEHKK